MDVGEDVIEHSVSMTGKHAVLTCQGFRLGLVRLLLRGSISLAS
jgi:hypothetical protein